jgi:hypothetical protein
LNDSKPRTTGPRTKDTTTFEWKHRGFVRRRIIRWVMIVLTAVLLAGGAIFVFNRVYNPFEDELSERSLLVLTPSDADAVVFIPDVPEWVGRIRDRGFVTALDKSRGFSQFLETDFARRTGVVQGLSKAFHQLDVERAKKTFGLDLFGDISGKEAGDLRVGTDPGTKDWKWLAVFRPESVRPLIGINLLLDKDLGALRRPGTREVRHQGRAHARHRDVDAPGRPAAHRHSRARRRDRGDRRRSGSFGCGCRSVGTASR